MEEPGNIRKIRLQDGERSLLRGFDVCGSLCGHEFILIDGRSLLGFDGLVVLQLACNFRENFDTGRTSIVTILNRRVVYAEIATYVPDAVEFRIFYWQ